jgi:drug/metabolite transporter (DMT)-like permease
MLGIAAALASAAVSALAVVAVGKNSKKSNAVNVSLVISVIGLVILWPLALLLTNFAAANVESIALFAINGALTPGLVRLLYYNGMKKLGTSVNSSIFAVYPLYSSILAILVLSESPRIENWIGMFAVILGVVLVEMSSRENNCEDKRRRCLLFPLLGGLTLGLSTIIRKAALNLYDAPVLGIAVAYTFSFLPYAIVLALNTQTRKELALKRDLRLFWVAGIGQAISWTLSFYALSLDTVSVINPVLSMEPIFVVILAYLFLRELERVTPRLIGSVALAVFGVVLVTI